MWSGMTGKLGRAWHWCMGGAWCMVHGAWHRCMAVHTAWCMGGVPDGGWVKACVYFLVGKSMVLLPGLVMLDLGVGSGLDGDVDEEEEEELNVVEEGSGLVQFMKWKIYNLIFLGGILGCVTLGGGVSYLGDLAMKTFNRQGGREVGSPLPIVACKYDPDLSTVPPVN